MKRKIKKQTQTKQKIEKIVPDFINKFLDYQKYIKKENGSENTIQAYKSDIYYFFEWLKVNKNVDVITLDALNTLVIQDLHDWITSMKVSASTKARKISTIHSLFRYLNLMNFSDSEVAKKLHKPKLPKDNRAKYLTREVATKLKNTVFEKGSELDYAIIMVFLNSGVRISELVNLNLNSLDGKILTVYKSKGGKSRQIAVSQETVDAVKRYLKVRPKIKDNTLFVLDYFNGEPYRITKTSVENMIEKYRIMCKIKHLTPHTLRHTFATMKREAGVSLDTLKDLLGHESIRTVLIYAQTTLEEKERVADLGSI